MSDADTPLPPTPPTPPASSGSDAPSAEERQWAMFAHLSALLGGLLTAGWGCFIGPLVIWLVKKDTMSFVDDQGKEALNFNITIAAIFVVLWMFTVMTLGLGGLIAMPLMFVIGVVALVFVVIAAMKANEGNRYRYPFAIRLIK